MASGHADVGRGDAALRVEHALEDRGVGLGEAGLDTGSSASAWARPSSSLPARPHSIIATNRAVQRCAAAAIAPGAAHAHVGNSERVVAAEQAEPARRAGQDLERVGVERADRLLHARDVRDARPARAARRRPARGRCGTGML